MKNKEIQKYDLLEINESEINKIPMKELISDIIR